MSDDPQLAALVAASGHTVADALLILTKLNHIGWTVRPITGFLATLPAAAAAADPTP